MKLLCRTSPAKRVGIDQLYPIDMPSFYSAQGYEGWILHQYPNVGVLVVRVLRFRVPVLVSSRRSTVPANPDWYDQAATERQRRAASLK